VPRLPDLLAALERNRARLWKVIYLAVAGGLLCVGLGRRFALPLVPILDADSPNYLWSALLKLNGDGFIHNAGLNFLYPGGLFLLLRAFSDFRAIVILQHLLGVAAGGFFLLGWNRLHDFDVASSLSRGVHQAIGLLGAAIYLLSATPIIFEMQIRPEAVCMFAQMLWFWFGIQFLFYRLVSLNAKAAAFYGIGGVASALLLYSLKPSYALTALFTVAVIVWLTVRSDPGWKHKALFFGGSIAVVLAFLVPEHLQARDDRVSRLFLPQTLFSVHAAIIREQMGDDLANGRTTPFPRPWLQSAYDDLGAEIQRFRRPPPGQFSLLGFDPDYLMNGEHAIFTRWLQQLGSDKEYEAFLKYYYWRTLRERSFSFGKKICRQIGVFYSWECPAFLTYRRIPLVAWHYGRGLAVMKEPETAEQLRQLPAGRRLVAQTEELCSREILLDTGKRLFWCHRVFNRAYLPALFLSVGIALGVILVRKPARSARWPSFLVLFLYLPNLGNVLAISAVHSMEVQRYSTVQFAAALVAELWAIRYLLGLISALIARRAA
jgi:hypothetical protein